MEDRARAHVSSPMLEPTPDLCFPCQRETVRWFHEYRRNEAHLACQNTAGGCPSGELSDSLCNHMEDVDLRGCLQDALARLVLAKDQL
jgi:hypothetical protein